MVIEIIAALIALLCFAAMIYCIVIAATTTDQKKKTISAFKAAGFGIVFCFICYMAFEDT